MRARPPLIWALSGLLAAGCAASSSAPPTIRYGESACAECRMLINEARYAAAAVTAAGEPAVFDSIECLVRYLHRDGVSPARVWVHEYEADRWLVSDEAFYVASQEFTTPMGQGVVATASAPAADRLAGAVHGRVLRFGQLAALINDTIITHEPRSP